MVSNHSLQLFIRLQYNSNQLLLHHTSASLNSMIPSCLSQYLQRKTKDGKLLELKKKSLDLQDSQQIKSSNLSHFAGIFHAAQSLPGVCKILQPFIDLDRPESLVVDIVAKQGHVWVKVIARKGQALHLIWAGQGQYGERDLVKQAEDYISCAEKHPLQFFAPKVHFVFYNQVTIPMAEALEKLGIIVWGQRVNVERDVAQKLVDMPAMMEDSDDNDEYNEDDASNDKGNQKTSYYDPGCKGIMGKDCDLDNIQSENSSLQEDNDDDCTDYSCKHELFSSKVKNADLNSEKKQVCDEDEFQNSVSVGHNIFHEKLGFKGREHLQQQQFHKDKSDKINSSMSQNMIKKSDKDSIVSNFQFSSELFKTDFITNLLSAIPEFNLIVFKGSDTDNKSEAMIKKVNLDITTLIALVSSVTHGGCNFVFLEPLLTEQAAEERTNPVLKNLKQFLEDKELYACQTAVDDFLNILETLGGVNEKQRAGDLLKHVNIVPDQPSERTKRLPQTSKIKRRTKIIFGTGDQIEAITVSANSGFVRAAEHQGVSYAVYLHRSRALTEQKEKSAVMLTEKHLSDND